MTYYPAFIFFSVEQSAEKRMYCVNADEYSCIFLIEIILCVFYFVVGKLKNKIPVRYVCKNWAIMFNFDLKLYGT